jgi:hypothetical protein
MRRLLIALLFCLPSLGCGQTYMLYVPEAPFPSDEDVAKVEESDPRVECEFMTVLIDYSRSGMGLSPADVKVASRVANAMTKEFQTYGTHVTDVRKDAYWSLMILASNNERHDGYIFSALLAARNMNEGSGPGLAAYGTDEEESDEEISDLIKIPSMYNGLSYGPYTNLEDQAREYVRQAYNAVFPAARQLCEFEAAEKAREIDLDSQLPALPQPL